MNKYKRCVIEIESPNSFCVNFYFQLSINHFFWLQDCYDLNVSNMLLRSETEFDCLSTSENLLIKHGNIENSTFLSKIVNLHI